MGSAERDTQDMPTRDEARMEELYRAEFRRLVRFGVAVTGDREDGEEAAQQAFIAAWDHLDDLRDPDAAGAYLRKTLLNLVRRRSQRRKIELGTLRVVRDREAQRDHTSRMAMVEALQGLPVRQRACVALRYYEDLTEAQTAEVLGVSVGTVKSQTHKALRRLRGVIEEL